VLSKNFFDVKPQGIQTLAARIAPSRSISPKNFQRMSSIQVRPATLRDAKAIAETHVAAWQVAYKDLLPKATLDALSVQKRQAFWREAIDLCEPQVIVAHLDGELMGFAGFDRSRDKGTPSTTGEVWALYVKPQHWDKGAGLALWDACRDGLQEEGCTKATLWTYLRNERALRFFELAGFKRELGSARTTEVGGVRIEELRLHRSLV
jgi:ribosomal protein S18 acetylase RimI-like enzyme